MGMAPKLTAFFLLLLLSASFAEDFVAVNSLDGRDVLSGIFYAGVKGYPVRFMPSSGADSEVFTAKVGSGHSVLLIQSATVPASGFVESELKDSNNSVETYTSTDGGQTNLDLAVRSGATSFIVVDSAYSDSAISVLPYAYLTHSYVLLADSGNIGKITDIVRGKSVTIYGQVDSSVRSALAPFSPATIGTGDDKYADNVELARMLINNYHQTRAIVTDGASLEDGMVGTIPIILTGTIVPQVTYNFVEQEVKDGNLTGVLLIGGGLVNPVYDMRQRIAQDLAQQGISKSMSVLVKFAQAIPSAQSGTLALDIFQLPAYIPQLNITEVSYNTQTQSVMVGLEDTGDGSLYYNIEVRVQANGQDIQVFGQTETQLIERGKSAGLQYPLNLSSIQEGNVTAAVIVKFGSSKDSLEQFQTYSGPLTQISYADTSNVSVESANYEPDQQLLLVSIRNNGPETAYVFTTLTLTAQDGTTTTVTSPSITSVGPNSISVQEFPLGLTAAEVSLNKQLSVTINYGGRRGFLVNTANYAVPLGGAAASSSQLPLLLGAVAVLGVLVVLALVAAYFLFLGKKKKK